MTTDRGLLRKTQLVRGNLRGSKVRVESGQCIRENVTPLILIPCLQQHCYCCVERERQKKDFFFSVSEAVRQETRERENKSVPVWSLVTTRSKGIVQKDSDSREGVAVKSMNEGTDWRGIMSFYCTSLCTWPQCAILVQFHSFNVTQSHPFSEPSHVCTHTYTSASCDELELPHPTQQRLIWEMVKGTIILQQRGNIRDKPEEEFRKAREGQRESTG